MTTVPASVLQSLGVSSATIYRRVKVEKKWIAFRSKREGRHGQPEMAICVSSLPWELQLKVRDYLDKQARAAAEPDPVADGSVPLPDQRLDELAAALQRFSPPEYTLEQRKAVESYVVHMSRLCDEALKVVGSGQKAVSRARRNGKKLRGASSYRNGRRVFIPEIVGLASRAVSVDKTYLELYPSAARPPAVPTFLRYLNQYQQHGPVIFVPKQQTLRPDVDKRFKEVPREALNWLRANLQNYSTASLTLYGERWLEAATRHGWELPFTDSRPGARGSCYTWLHRWKRRLPAVTMTYLREGERGIEAKYEYIIRDVSDLKPRDGFVMDWKQFDVECWLPWRKPLPTGRGTDGRLAGGRGAGGRGSGSDGRPALARLWLCTVLDIASRAAFGYYIDLRPSARGVTLAYCNGIGEAEWKSEPGLELLRGIQRTGDPEKPAFVIWDNGKDYRSHTVEGQEITIKGFDLETGLLATLATYKVGLAPEFQLRVKRAKPFNAKSKIVEPWHGYGVGRREALLPGYKGIRADEKPHYYAAARRIHEREFIKGGNAKSEDLRQLPPLWLEVYERTKAEYGKGTPFLSEAEFRKEFIKILLKYLHTPHGSLTNDRGEMTPIEHLQLYADTPHMLTEQSMTALMMEPRVITVKYGELRISWYGEEFLYREVESDLSDANNMKRLPEKTQVEFRFDPANIGRGLVVTQSGPLCWVEEPELLGYGATQEQFKRAMHRKRRAVEVAREALDVRMQPPDWRDEVEQKVVPLKKAVGGDDIREEEDSTQDACAPRGAPGASITVPTRFDRGQRNRKRGKLRVVEQKGKKQEEEDEWRSDLDGIDLSDTGGRDDGDDIVW